MFVGTCSDAGKSILNTAFCRIFRQDGYRPAPFKAQNMSLNSCSTPEGGEIGRAQAVQAEACGILPHTDMNPVLLKPSTDQTSQVILNGKAVGNMSAREYFRSGNKTQLFTEAVKAFHRLEENHNPIVLEGAGSISELNVRDRDITNMRMAKEVDAATYLVADIDRGGVFASVYGSVMLLPEEERCLIKGVIINKFRGDVSLFEEGRQIIRELTGVPVVGVIPYYKDIHIEEEDSVALEAKASAAVAGKINVAVIRLPRMSNFTDFNALERDGRFHLYYTDTQLAQKVGASTASDLSQISSLIYASLLDGMIAGEKDFTTYHDNGFFIDLNEFLSEEELKAIEPYLYIPDDEKNTQKHAYGVYLEKSERYNSIFQGGGGVVPKPIYGIITNSENTERGRYFLYYLFPELQKLGNPITQKE